MDRLEEKIDKMTDKLADVATDIAVMKAQLGNYEGKLDATASELKKHKDEAEKNFRDLRRFKWTTVGGLITLQSLIPYIYKYLLK